MLLPGPEAQQLAIYIGWLLHGTWGGIVAGAFFVLPSIFILLGALRGLRRLRDAPGGRGDLRGLKPAVVAIVVAAVCKIGAARCARAGSSRSPRRRFAGIFILHVPFPLIVIGAGVIGFLAGRIWPRSSPPRARRPEQEPTRPTRPRSTERSPPVLAACAPHRRRPASFSGRSPPRAGCRARLVEPSRPPVPLLHPGGLRDLRRRVRRPRLRHAGGRRVLSLDHAAQAIDGLGLAETTPGPLIMVLQFVGFMAGWNRPEGMSRLASATVGAAVTTWVTFLPCFFYIFLGAPYVEGLRETGA